MDIITLITYYTLQVLVGGMDVLANITCMVAIRLLGKRVMCLLAVFGSGVCCFILSTLQKREHQFRFN